jgi:hypothetical protein
VTSAYRRASQISSHQGFTGAQAASTGAQAASAGAQATGAGAQAASARAQAASTGAQAAGALAPAPTSISGAVADDDAAGEPSTAAGDEQSTRGRGRRGAWKVASRRREGAPRPLAACQWTAVALSWSLPPLRRPCMKPPVLMSSVSSAK